MTQHNAALVEETNAAIEQTEAQANELDRIVDVFVLDETDNNSSVSRLKVAPRAPAAKPAPASTAAASKGYLSEGNAALKQDWSEF